jgi:hypothetical protein
MFYLYLRESRVKIFLEKSDNPFSQSRGKSVLMEGQNKVTSMSNFERC